MLSRRTLLARSVNLGLAGAGFSAALSPRPAAAAVLTAVTGSPFTTGTSNTIAYSVAFHPGGKMLASANDAGNSTKSSVTVFTVQSSGALTPLTGGWTGTTSTSVAFSPDGKLLAAANSGDNGVSLFWVGPPFKAVTGSPFATGPGDSPYAVAFAPTGPLAQPMFATADWINNSHVSVFAFKAGAWQPAVSYPNGANACGGAPVELAFHPGGGWLACANGVAGSVSVFSVAPGGVLTLLGSQVVTACSSPVNTLAFSPNGNLLATGSGSPASVEMLKFSNGVLTKLGSQPIGDKNTVTNSVTFHPTLPLLAAADGSGVSLFAVTANGALTLLTGSPFAVANNASPKSLAFSPDGKLLAVGTMSWASLPRVWMFQL